MDEYIQATNSATTATDSQSELVNTSVTKTSTNSDRELFNIPSQTETQVLVYEPPQKIIAKKYRLRK